MYTVYTVPALLETLHGTLVSGRRVETLKFPYSSSRTGEARRAGIFSASSVCLSTRPRRTVSFRIRPAQIELSDVSRKSLKLLFRRAGYSRAVAGDEQLTQNAYFIYLFPVKSSDRGIGGCSFLSEFSGY